MEEIKRAEWEGVFQEGEKYIFLMLFVAMGVEDTSFALTKGSQCLNLYKRKSFQTSRSNQR